MDSAQRPGLPLAVVVVACGIVGIAWALARASPLAPPPDDLAAKRLMFPIPTALHAGLRDSFHEKRGLRAHEAVDIMAPRGTPVFAVEDGRVARLFHSIPGGKTVYLFDPTEKYAYYYAHLDRYAPGLAEKQLVKRGDVIGYVGSTGNAPANAPHLHFAIFRLGPLRQWWKGEPIDPFPYLNAAGAPARTG